MRLNRRNQLRAFAAAAASMILTTGCGSLMAGATQRRVAANTAEADRQLDLGNEASARLWFDRAVKLAPSSPATYLGPNFGSQPDLSGGLIDSLLQHNDWPDMEHYLSQATAEPQLSNQWTLWSNLAQAQQRMGETAAARGSYQRELSALAGHAAGSMSALPPEYVTINKADAEWNVGQQSAARSDLLHLISRHPEAAAEAQNELAYEEALSKVNLPEAATLAAQAVSAARSSGDGDEGLGECLDTLGWVQYRQGQYGTALSNLEEAIAYIPREPVTHYHLAEVYAALRQPAAAQIEIQRAAYLDPSDLDTKTALRQIAPPAAPQVPATPQPSV